MAMRILIISDVHANPWALAAVEREAGVVDQIICAGDTVNYGPDPRAAVAWLRERGAITVRGNHDHAVAFQTDPRANPAKQALALAMADWTRARLDPADRLWLCRLPIRLHWEIAGVRFVVIHATPIDPLYDYRLTPRLRDAILDDIAREVQGDVLILGHTHLPLVRRHGDLQIVNPGSLGQPLDGDARAPYVVWEDGMVHARRAEYDRTPALEAIGGLPLEAAVRKDLADMLEQAKLET